MLAGGFYSQGGGGGGLTKALDTTITRGNAVVATSTKEVTTDQSTYINYYDLTAYGFDAGSDYYAYGPGFGSIATGTYTDANSTSRLVDSCYFIDATGQPAEADYLYFCIDTTSVPNTDSTFKYIVINGFQYNRADSFYIASSDGGTIWEWVFDLPGVTDPFGGAPGGYSFEVWVE
jgi:hypothetical protein